MTTLSIREATEMLSLLADAYERHGKAGGIRTHNELLAILNARLLERMSASSK